MFNNFMENYIKFLKSVDEDLKKIFDYQKEYLFCKEGCSYCCKRGDYPITELEFKYLMSGYEQLPEDIKSVIQKNIETAKKSDRENYVCPFLINEKCSIYQYRPFVCRAFGVLTEDVKGKPAFPFCAALGLNFSQIYDKENKHLSDELVDKGNFKIYPKIFRLNNRVFMNLPLAKELNLDFGEDKKMIDFL